MAHIDEHTIDLYVLNPERLAEEARNSVSEHLQICAACKALAEDLRAFYTKLGTSADSHSEDVSQIMKRVFPPPFIIQLHPYRPQPMVNVGDDSYTSVLAAMSVSPSQGKRLETVATLASETENVVVRLHHDTMTNKFKLYLYADDPLKQEAAIVSIPDISAAFVLDERGQAEFQLPESKVPKDWTHLSALVRLPMAKFKGSAAQVEGAPDRRCELKASADDYAIRIAVSGEVCSLEVMKENPPPEARTAVIKGVDGESALVDLQDGKGILHIPAWPKEFEVRLYA